VADDRVVELIRGLGLQPHPEGGFFREIFRSDVRVQPHDRRTKRAAVTTIYFLLPAGAHSRWHRVQSDEVWHLYEGGPLELFTAPPECDVVHRTSVGLALASDGPVQTVPGGWWQAARATVSYALAGCTVAPGFEFSDFTLLKDEPKALARLLAAHPDVADLV
jgi:predicted cupin superfamily sugar epimerase